MQEERLFGLLKAIESHIGYCNIIEYPDIVNDKTIDFDLLRAIFDGFYLSMRVEEFLIFENEEVKDCKLIDEFLKHLANIISKDNGNGFTLGELSYKDERELFKKIRNKLAHGDFIVKNGEIIFEENNAKGIIKVDALSSAIRILDTESENYQKCYQRKKDFFICTKPKNINPSIEELCDSACIIELYDNPIFPKTKDAEYCKLVKYTHETILKKGSGQKEKKEVFEILDKIKKRAAKYGISLQYNIKTLKELPYYTQIKEKYIAELKTTPRLNLLDNYNKICILVNFAYRIGKGQYQKFDIKKGLFDNNVLLERFSVSSNRSFTETVNSDEKLLKIMLHDYDVALLSSYLVGFNSLYQYGLEKVLTTNENYGFVSLYKGNSLDFSKFDFSLFESDVEYTGKKRQLNNDILKYQKENMGKLDCEIRRLDNIIEGIKLSKNPDKEKIERMQKEKIEIQEAKIKLQEEINTMEEHYRKFDVDKYNKNLNIIFNIRNALAHGDIYIDCYSNNLMETDIIIENIHEGEICYRKQMKVKEFVNIFRIFNIEVIKEFINNIIGSKKEEKVKKITF